MRRFVFRTSLCLVTLAAVAAPFPPASAQNLDSVGAEASTEVNTPPPTARAKRAKPACPGKAAARPQSGCRKSPR